MAKGRALKAEIKALRELINERDLRYSQRFDAQQEAVAAALSSAKEAAVAKLDAAKEAVAKAEAASERRFESVNEFRGALSDQTASLMTRTEADQRFKVLEDFTSQQRGAADSAKSGRAALFAILGLGVPLLLAIIGGFAILIDRLPP